MLKLLVVVILAQQSPQQSPMSLEDCIRAALRKNVDVGLAQKDVESARARKLGTRAGYLPRLDMTLQDGYYFTGSQEVVYGFGGTPVRLTQPASDDDTHYFGLRLSQNIFDGGKWWNQVERADKSINVTRLALKATRESIAHDTIATFYELLKAQKEAEVLRQSLETSLDQLRLAEERYRLGAASRVDVAVAKVNMGEDRIAIQHQQRVIGNAMVNLNRVMGRSPLTALVIQEPGDTQDLAGSPSYREVPETHFLLRMYAAAQERANLDVTIAKGDRWPQVSGSISYSRQDPEFYKVYSRFDQLYRLAFLLNISFPIFDGFLTSSNIDRAEVASERVKLEKFKARQDLEMGLSKALTDFLSLRAISRIEADNIVAAEQRLELAKESYEVGQGTALELREAQLALNRAKLTAVQTRYELRIAFSVYHQARGDLLKTYLPKENP
jgi:outer membrane protein TolC